MSGTKTLLGALGMLMAVCLFTGCGREPIPPEIVGRWTTSAPPYEKASMEITAESITFKNGKGYVARNRITHLEKKEGKDGTLYKIAYDGDEGGPFVLSFYLKQVQRGKDLQTVMEYKNQKNLTWIKQAGQTLQPEIPDS